MRVSMGRSGGWRRIQRGQYSESASRRFRDRGNSEFDGGRQLAEFN